MILATKQTHMQP